jgi:thiamine-monophosphate kinase
MDEFSLIDHFFKPFPLHSKEVVFGIGDDAACLHLPADKQLLISTDTLVSGVHFLPHWDAAAIASKAARVNISDMAAMAAEPRWITLALTLPDLNPSWLESFAKGLQNTLNQFSVELIGGDTTHGPLSVTITILGLAPQGGVLKRSGAQPGDIIMVSGPLGAAALAVHFLDKPKAIAEKDNALLMQYLLHPQPRVDLIPLLRTHASAAIDISDGLSADLNHICQASGTGACFTQESIPVHPLLMQYVPQQALDFALSGGDDYELCFTVPPAAVNSLMQALKEMNLVCYPVGVIESTKGLRIKTVNEPPKTINPQGYKHFGGGERGSSHQ